MRAVIQEEWQDTGWETVAVYLFTRKLAMGRARQGRNDTDAWVQSVLAGAVWSPGENMEDLADQLIERFSHQEYGTLYEEVEPAPTLDMLGAREFLGEERPPFATEQPKVSTALPSDLAGWKTRLR